MKPLSQQTLYEILDVPPDANPAVIAEAVDRASALYAPGSLATYTLMAPDEEQLMARRLEEARTTLLDPTARARYDERLSVGEPVFTPPPTAASAAPAEVDPALRAAWPELPPVVPAAAGDRDADWSEDDEGDGEVEAAPTPPRPAAPAAPPPEPRPLPPVIPALAAPPAASVASERAEPQRGIEPSAPVATPLPSGIRPILLSREVAPATAAPTQVAMQPAATPTPALVPDGTAWSGEVLRKLREARGISLQQISERTKVTRHHIENIEADRYEQLPAPVYLRGILLSIARELRLDGQKVSRSYLERVTAATSTTAPVQRPR